MRFTELRAADLPAGELALWTPTAPPGAFAADPRPPALVHECHVRDHVRAARLRGVDRSPTWVGVGFAVETTDRGAIAAALGGWLARHEHLRSTFTVADDGCHRRTAPASAVRVRVTPVPGRLSGIEAAHRAERFFDEGIDPLAWPPVRFATIASAGRTTVLVAADHGVVDGVTLATIPGELRDLLARRTLPDPRPTFLDFGACEPALLAGAAEPALAMAPWWALLGPRGTATPAFPLLADDQVGPQLSTDRWCADAALADRFDESARAAGAGPATAVLACLAEAADRLTGRPLPLVSLVDTRPPPWRAAPGWFVGLRPLVLRTDPDGFPATVARVAAYVRAVSRTATMTLPRLASVLGHPVHPRFVVSYLDVRAARRPPNPADLMLRSRVHGPAEVYLWFTRSERGLHVSSRHPGSAAIGVELFLDTVRDVLRTAADETAALVV